MSFLTMVLITWAVLLCIGFAAWSVIMSARKVQISLITGTYRVTGITKDGFTFDVFFTSEIPNDKEHRDDVVYAIRCWCFRRGAKCNSIRLVEGHASYLYYRGVKC